MLARPGAPEDVVADIFREVDEELSRDRAVALARKYGKYVIAFAVAAVAGVALFGGWQDYRERQRQAEGRAYAQAIDLVLKEDTKAATAAMAEIASQGGSYGLLALLEEASLKVKAGDRAGALAIYNSLAADSSARRPFRDLATVLSVLISLDSGDPASLRHTLEPLTAQDQPFRPSAQELLGLLALRQGDFAAAKKQFRLLADDPAAPSGMRRRATQILAWI